MDTGTSSKAQTSPPPPTGTSPAQTAGPASTASPDLATAASRRDWLLDHPPARSLPFDQEALRIYQHAYAIGLQTEPQLEPVITFSTVLMALFLGQDETSRWFAGEAAKIGPDASLVFAGRSAAEDAIRQIQPVEGHPDVPRLSVDKQLLTSSARAVVEAAELWAQLVGATDIGVRHVLAAYVLNPPPAHYAQLERWNYEAAGWRDAFYAWTAQRYTAEPWNDTRYRPAPAKRMAGHERAGIKGEALGSASDPLVSMVRERAAVYHARSKDGDRFLRLQTLFCGLVESAAENADLRATVQPIWNAVEKARTAYDQARDAHFPTTHPARSVVPFSACDLSSRVVNALETARELTLASRSRGGGAPADVGVLQLAGALVSLRVDASFELAKFGLDAQTLRDDLIEHAAKLGERIEVWKEAVGDEELQFVGRPVDLNSDEPEAAVRTDEKFGDDPLRIRADVETFASLLASSSLQPPLAMGLFGPWGSGKTTFLKRLRRAVDAHATAAAEDVRKGQPTAYASNIVHVEFNAWHFAETALTSSLVDTIFRALNSYIKDEQPIGGKKWRDVKQAELASTGRKLEAARAAEQAARKNVKRAETAFTESQVKAAEAFSTLEAASHTVWKALKDELKKTPQIEKTVAAAGDAVTGVQDLRAKLMAVRDRPARLIGDLGWPATVAFGAMILAAPPLVAWLVAKVTGTGQVVQSLSTVGAMLSVFVTWAKSATGAVSQVDAAIAKVVVDYERRIAADPEVAGARAALESAKTAAATAAASMQVAQQELARAQAEAAAASLPAQMLRLVSNRVDAETYKKELTTISLAREDLQMISALLRTPEEAAAGDQAQGSPSTANPRAVDRVILYIDDLDRCRPDDVVRVLQLVHMLLAFELFAVVVAVDPQWVYASLAESYDWLARDDERATARNGRRPSVADPVRRGRDGVESSVTPQDYLEKIFQIVFWLEPMTSTRAARYLGSLVPSPTREERWQDVTDIANGQLAAAAPVKIGIAGIELDYMRALAAHVGTSPRRVKRLVNAYRLLKASLTDSQLRTFLTNRSAEGGGDRSGPYQIVIGLLVIGTGVLGSSARILAELSDWDPNQKWTDVMASFRSRDDADWTQAARVLDIVFGTQKPQDVAELRGWARKVNRYLLSGPVAERFAVGFTAPPGLGRAS